MITLKESILADNEIKESILSDMEDTLSVSDNKVYKKLYPVPKMRDFYKENPYSRTFLDWECPLLIKDFAKIIENVMQKYHDGFKAENIVGIQFALRKPLTVSLGILFNMYLYDKNNENRYHIDGLPKIVFDKKANTIAEAKKMVIDFVKNIYANPDDLNRLGNKLNQQ